jgi:hypothetical protein
MSTLTKTMVLLIPFLGKEGINSTFVQQSIFLANFQQSSTSLLKSTPKADDAGWQAAREK